jgi:hypothetical protein
MLRSTDAPMLSLCDEDGVLEAMNSCTNVA